MDYYMPEPPKDPRNKSTILAILLLIFLVLYMCSCSTEQYKHKCEWTDCIYYNEVINTIVIPSEEDTNEYLFDLTHLKYPDWTKEQCETYVFSN